MFNKLLATICLSMLFHTAISQSNMAWKNWSWLMGTWKGEGNGRPGQGSGTFSFTPDLDQHILVRKAHSEYPSASGKAAVHDDLLIVYMGNAQAPDRAIYFDNEGHTIQYTITVREKDIVFLSDVKPGVPVFRLTYTLLDPETVNTTFEMAQNGSDFTKYIEGKSRKVQ